MKLYMHPVSTVSRPVRLFLAENGIKAEEIVVDLFAGAHHQEPYRSLNPSRQVPLLEEYDLPSYPKDLKKRAKVNEVMDWLNTGFYRDFGYGLVYPQLFPHHKRRSDEAHAGAIEWGQANSKAWLKVLNDHYIGPTNQYLTGNQITIADYFGAGLVSIAELIDCDLADYPNVRRWLGNMKTLKNWNTVNEVFTGFVRGNKGKEFARV